MKYIIHTSWIGEHTRCKHWIGRNRPWYLDSDYLFGIQTLLTAGVFRLSLSQSGPFITGFVTRVTWQVPHMEQELLTFQEHQSSSVFSGVHCFPFVLLIWSLHCLSFWINPLVSSNFLFTQCESDLFSSLSNACILLISESENNTKIENVTEGLKNKYHDMAIDRLPFGDLVLSSCV